MSIIKQRLLKLATLGIGLALTLAIGTAIGMFDQQHLAFAFHHHFFFHHW